METKISLDELSLDEIIRKFKALKNDTSIISMSLTINRKSQVQLFGDRNQKNRIDSIKKSSDNKVSNVQRLYYQRQKSKKKVQKQFSYQEDNVQQIDMHPEDKQNFHNRIQSLQSKINTKSSNFMFITDKRIKKGIRCYNLGNYDEAISILNEVKDQFEREISQKSSLISSTNQYQDSEHNNNELKRNISNLTYHLGNCYYKKKNLEEAIQQYLIDYPQQSPQQKGLRKGNLATCYAYQQKNQLALSKFKQALNFLDGFQTIDLSNIYYNIGIIYLKQEMPESASKYLKHSIEQRKNKSPQCQDMLFNTYFQLGIALRQMGNVQQSLKILIVAESYAQRGVGSNKISFWDVEKQIALCYERLGKWQEAFTYYESMLNKAEQGSLKKAYLFRRVGLIYKFLKNYKQAEKCLKISADQYQKRGDQLMSSKIRQEIILIQNQ